LGPPPLFICATIESNNFDFGTQLYLVCDRTRPNPALITDPVTRWLCSSYEWYCSTFYSHLLLKL